MHASVIDWCAARAMALLPGPRILEVGSADVNGSIRPAIERILQPTSYVGVDVAAGPGVDLVAPGGIESVPLQPVHDLVVSCEMLEHARDWQAAFRAMASALAVGGHLLLTCRGPGFPRHNPPDHWRFTCRDLIQAANLCGLRVRECIPDPQVPGVFLFACRDAWPTVAHAPE